ncbi:MAG: transcription antitermination factor NusB [Erysipelotrichaceae bacterium]|nr:transcription antitermination factor NusB [Erysipelotrichaceae bacterium]MDP3306260.1 transcription antitermination factor NusB [Erysipelotrichaceae bacterium]
MTSRRKQRVNAMLALYQVFLLNRDIEDVFEDIDYILSEGEPAFLPFSELEEPIKTMLIDAYEHQSIVIDKINEQLSDWDFVRLGVLEQAILFLAVSEMVYETADRAVIINEAVDIAKQYCDDDAFKLVNGVLDKL